jgi:hypothetical protein
VITLGGTLIDVAFFGAKWRGGRATVAGFSNGVAMKITGYRRLFR